MSERLVGTVQYTAWGLFLFTQVHLHFPFMFYSPKSSLSFDPHYPSYSFCFAVGGKYVVIKTPFHCSYVRAFTMVRS